MGTFFTSILLEKYDKDAKNVMLLEEEISKEGSNIVMYTVADNFLGFYKIKISFFIDFYTLYLPRKI